MSEKEDYISIPQESRLAKSQRKTRKGKQIITQYSNGLHHWTKWANLYKSEISLR